jgi:hypothetical protein
MTGIIIVAIVIIAIIYFVNQSNEEKRKIEEEKKRQDRIKYQAEQTKKQEEEKQLALIQQKKLEEKKKLDEANRLEKIRLQKIEDEKYETFTIVVVGQSNGKYTCVLKRQNNTYAYVGRPETAFQLNATMKLLKDKANDFEWINETQHNKKQKELKEQKEREEEIARQNALQAIETEQRNFCENNTTYCTDIQAKYNSSPRNFGLTSIKSLSTPFYNSISEEMQNRIFAELNQGVAILQTEGHLFIYMRSYGNMHQAKLLQSFEAISNLQNLISNKEIQINDYGCGQGIGSIVFIDYLKSIQATNFKISKVKLIEPSEIALKRASLNIKYCLRSINQDENVLSIPKRLDDITNIDISTNSQAIKFHIFSNIIDVESISIQSMCAKIAETQKGINYFICVSPNIMQSRNERLDAFMNYFQQRQNVSIISTREDNINTWRRYERVFNVTM